MRMFLRKPAVGRDPLAVTMSGVRMGERVLQIGVNDAALAGTLAAKVGLSGHAALVVTSDAAAERARAGAAHVGGLLEVTVTPLDALPFEEGSFDVVIVHSMDNLLASMAAETRLAALHECQRVLRPGGRIVALDPGARTGLSALLRSTPAPDEAYERAGGTVAALLEAGFRPVRIVGEREGFKFTEGLKSARL